MLSLDRPRDERGATAVLFAVVAVVLLGASALAVDVGQVYAKRAALQSNVDMAVMAAAAELDSSGACNQEVIDAATDYLTKDANEVPDQAAIDLGGSASDGNGFITCNNWKVDLWAPTSRVDFGLARAVTDEAGVDVPAHAAAQIKSPGIRELPMYAVSGCDSGHQTISDPPPGPAPTPVVPDLSPGGDPPYNAVSNLSINAPNPAEIPASSVTPQPMTLKGKNLTGTTFQVWFTNADDQHFQAPGSLGLSTSGSNFTITIPTVPQEVLDASGIWYVRIFNDGKWSSEADAQPLVVGDLMFCDGTVSGNFGTLKIARDDGPPATWLETNIMKGFQPTFAVNPSSAVPCSPEDSASDPTDGTDCVGTDPGFPNEAATDGFINGNGSTPGRLKVATTPGCDRNGGDSLTTDHGLNDDVLACFITGGHSVGDVITGTEHILSADIFTSPRFFMIPVIPVEASNGASGSYPIIGFRPGFITEEPDTATEAARGSVSGDNGIHFHSTHVDEVNVVLFPDSALPETAPPVGGETDYTGHGTRVVVLVG